MSSLLSYLDVKNLSCERNNRPLFSGLNLTVKPGQLWHIKGANGVGKTSFLRQISGLLPCEQGEIIWHTDQMLYIGHKLAQKDSLTVDENLAWITQLCTSTQAVKPSSPSKNRRAKALAQTGLSGYEDVMTSQLSAGQRRRLCLARLYVSKAKVWILDEPMTALDKHAIAWQQAWYKDHLKAGGAVVLSSHQDIDLPINSEVHSINLDEYTPTLPPQEALFSWVQEL